MGRRFIYIAALLLAGCAGATSQTRVPSPCDASEAAYECQVERYNNVSG